MLSALGSFASILFRHFSSRKQTSYAGHPARSVACLLFCLLALPVSIWSQPDTVICYDALNHKIVEEIAAAPGNQKISDFTDCYFGTTPGYSQLSTAKPQNTYNNSGSTDFTPAHLKLPVTDFPARTSVKIFRYVNGTPVQRGSGTLISRNMVLTAAHLLCQLDTVDEHSIYYDSLYVVPAYDNGMPQKAFPGSVSSKYYIPKAAFKSFWNRDIAIIELREPVGTKTGWIGIGFSTDDNFYKNNVFHKFSYPGTRDLFDSTRVYNGDTLYYNYGTLDLVETGFFGYDIMGVPGQSGSSMFYTDNKNYYSLGVQSFAAMSSHTRILNTLFYSFKKIIEKDVIASAQDKIAAVTDYKLFNAYPNPFNPATNISYELPGSSHVDLKVYDILGKEVATLVSGWQNAGRYTFRFDAANLPSGVYIYRLKTDNYSASQKLMLIK